MSPAVRLALPGLVLLLAAPLAGCGASPAQSGKELDNALAGAANEADPALTRALQDQIMVDPTLAGQRRHGAVPPGPRTAPVPAEGGPHIPVDANGLLHVPAPTAAGASPSGITLGELARSQATPARRSTKNCDKTFHYSMQWASRLPAALPLYPDARVSEAAGNDAPACRVRVVSFTSDAALGTVLDWYYTKAIRGGYTAEHQIDKGDHILGGTRESDGSAYYLIASARKGGGTQVDIIANNGR